MSKPIPQKYKTTNWRSYNADLKSRGSLTIWFDPGMNWRAAPTGKPGRPLPGNGLLANHERGAIFSDAAIQTCLTLARQVIAQQSPKGDEGAVSSTASAGDWPG